jgi:hypothetical protein
MLGSFGVRFSLHLEQMKSFLTNLLQNHICRYYTRQHIGSGNGCNFNHVRTTWTIWEQHAAFWRQWSWKFSSIMGGDSAIDLVLRLPIEHVLRIFLSCWVHKPFAGCFSTFQCNKCHILPRKVKAGTIFSPLSKKNDLTIDARIWQGLVEAAHRYTTPGIRKVRWLPLEAPLYAMWHHGGAAVGPGWSGDVVSLKLN